MIYLKEYVLLSSRSGIVFLWNYINVSHATRNIFVINYNNNLLDYDFSI